MKFEKVADLIKYLQQFNPEAEVLTEMDFSYFKKPLHTNENSIKTSTPGIFIYGSYKLDVGLVSTIKDEDNKIVSTEILKKDLISNAYTNIMKYIEKNIVSKYPTFTRAYMVMNALDEMGDVIKSVPSAEDLEHDGEEHECSQDASQTCCEEDQKCMKDFVPEPALEA